LARSRASIPLKSVQNDRPCKTTHESEHGSRPHDELADQWSIGLETNPTRDASASVVSQEKRTRTRQRSLKRGIQQEPLSSRHSPQSSVALVCRRIRLIRQVRDAFSLPPTPSNKPMRCSTDKSDTLNHGTRTDIAALADNIDCG